MTTGRLAATSDYPYIGYDFSCLMLRDTADSLIAAKISDVILVGKTEDQNIAALAEGSLSMIIQATDRFMSYSSGILSDRTCSSKPNHAVTGVGYTPTYILLKNSWGTKWGDSGFVKVARGYSSACKLFDYSSYPALAATGEQDSDPDPATSYNPKHSSDEESGTAEPCLNTIGEEMCKEYDDLYNYCQYPWFIHDYCKKYCGLCGCPDGTILCADGGCRHEHLC